MLRLDRWYYTQLRIIIPPGATMKYDMYPREAGQMLVALKTTEVSLKDSAAKVGYLAHFI